MIDQATELRKLVVRSLRESAAATGPPPRLVVVTGAAGGAGATAMAVNLAVALGDQGLRVVVVDADRDRADVATVCGLDGPGNEADSNGARRDIHEVMRLGPAGTQIVPGVFPQGQHRMLDELSQERLLRQFKTLGRHADLVLVDAGSGETDFLARCRQAADDLLLVTTPDSIALSGCRAQVEAAGRTHADIRWRLVVNQCPEPSMAEHAFATLSDWFQEPHPTAIDLLGSVPIDETVVQAEESGLPFVISHPDCPAAVSVQQLAAALLRPEDGRRDVYPAAA